MPLAPWEPAERVKKAIDSLHKQTWPAQRLVISVDGQVSTQLKDVVRHAPLPVLLIESPFWRGTGPTLAAGLEACRCEWVLRADADDRSIPQRAEQQLLHLNENPNLAVLGCQLRERSSEKNRNNIRSVPLKNEQIRQMLDWRNPINHPTVAINRKKILKAGNYRACLGFEDWYLWMRLKKCNLEMENLPEILVIAEVDKNHLDRRHGYKYARQEIRFFRQCYEENMLSSWRIVLLTTIRVPWRLMPKFWLARIMSIIRCRIEK